jgi:hypothetical protein
MKNVTLQFYSTASSLITVLIIAYAITLRATPISAKFTKIVYGRRVVKRLRQAAIFPQMISLVPFAALIVGVGGEAACLNALYTGHPTSGNAGWAIAAVVIMSITLAGHALIAAAVRYSENNPTTAEKSPTTAGEKLAEPWPLALQPGTYNRLASYPSSEVAA